MSMMAEPTLPTCAGVRANAVINMPQPVAPKTAARINTTMPSGSPHFTWKKSELARIRIPTCAMPVKKMPKTFPPKNLPGGWWARPADAAGFPESVRQGSNVRHRNGEHQKHQRHAGRHICKDVEFDGCRPFLIFFFLRVMAT